MPEELHFSPAFALAVVGFGDEQAHAGLIQPIKEALTPIVELVTPIPYVGLQQMFDASAPWGFHNYEKAVYLAELSDGAIDAILEHQAKKMSPLSFVPIFPLGGVYRRADNEASAFGGNRETRWIINISATTPSADEYDAERAWSRNYWSALVPHADGIGSYVNFMTDYEDDRIPECLWSEVRPPAAAQGQIRPTERLPHERQHPSAVIGDKGRQPSLRSRKHEVQVRAAGSPAPGVTAPRRRLG